MTPAEPPTEVSRRTLLRATAAGATMFTPAVTSPQEAAAAPASGRQTYSLNLDWKFIKQNVSGAQQPAYDDSAWTTVSVPHTYNDVDSFDDWITSSGESSVAMQPTWYRKRFQLPADHAGRKVLLELEGIRQAATVYLNGSLIGTYEHGVTPFGFDLTDKTLFGADNVLAICTDNTKWRPETATGMPFQWDTRDFNPTFGGLTRNVTLHVLPKTYFTLPLYSNLRTTGTYVYPTAVNVSGHTATINAEAQIRNEETTARTLTVSAELFDSSGTVVGTLPAVSLTVAAGATQTAKLSSRISKLIFWSPSRPALYTVRLTLVDGSTTVDTHTLLTGFRKAEFKGGAATGGVHINDQFLWLTGYAQRATNEWAVLGDAVPEWLRSHDGELIRASNANLIRWMHIAAQPSNIRMTDRYGLVSIQPAGDKESDATGRQWEQRLELMRDVMIYFRNSPSILFWESGNNWITAEHQQQMRELKQTWDPYGARAIGSRATSDNAAYGGTAAVDQCEYIGTMLNRHYSDYARDRMPIIESEYTRDEAPRRVWDTASPPDFGYVTGPDVTYHWTSEDFAGTLAASLRHEFWSQRVQGPGNRRYSGAAALTWADSNQHGRQYGWETGRLSGRVDAVRIPKESYHTYRVMQSPAPDLHVIGHWSYPSGTTKTVYVMAAHVARVDLLVNGSRVGSSNAPQYEFLYTFPGVAWQSGTITAVGYDSTGAEVVRAQKETAGAAVALKLTPYTSPDGLKADGTDVVMLDVEAVDAQGRRVPTDQARVDFTLAGPGRLLGGYNPGKRFSVFQTYVDTEAGINRVFVRTTRTAGAITVRATRSGLATATITVTSMPVTTTGGLVPLST
jgi:beta-galactosidase